MKNFLALIGLLCGFSLIPIISSSQINLLTTHTSAEPLKRVFHLSDLDNSPEFPGGKKQLVQYLNTNLKYPELARENGIEGKVTIEFTIDSEGSITDPKIAGLLGYGCDEEVVRNFQNMPKWQPGIINKQAVDTRLRMSVNFKLSEF